MRYLLPFVLLILSQALLAAGDVHGGHEGPLEIPEVVFYQALNAGLFFLILFLVLRPHVKTFFSGRESSFNQAKVKAEELLSQAQKSHSLIQEKLSRLEEEAGKNLESARAEAEVLKKDIIQSAEEISQRVKTESARAGEREVAIAREVLRKEMMEKALQAAEKVLNEKLSLDDKKKLQTEFYQKVQVVK